MLPVARDVRLRIHGTMPALDPALDAVVEQHWQAALRTRRLFNGQVFCADTVTAHEIAGHWTEYRRIVAQMADPALCGVLRVRALAVCGVLTGPDGVAVGRREPRSAYQPGLWQLPPAGSVDAGAAVPGGADWRRALLAELREELGIAETDVRGLQPLCLVQHPSGVLDLGVRIDTGLGGAEIVLRHRTLGDGEYDRLLVAPAAQVERAVAHAGGRLVPSAPVFLAACGGAD